MAVGVVVVVVYAVVVDAVGVVVEGVVVAGAVMKGVAGVEAQESASEVLVLSCTIYDVSVGRPSARC